MRTRWLFLLCLFAVFAASQSAWAQCPPTDPTFVFPGPLANYSVDEGSTTGVAVLGGGPVFEWDTDCDGVTTSRGDMIGPSSFVYTAKNRDGDSAARLCVRSFNPTCPAAQRFSAQVRADVRIRNVAPTITTNLLPIAAVGRVFSFTLAATDPANPPVAASVLDAFTWSATGLPMGLSINATTGAITGTPAAGTAGSYMVTVTVIDGDGGTNSRIYPLVVAPTGTNQPCPTPMIAGTVGTMLTVNEGATLMMSARIPDGGACSCRVAWDLGCDGSVDVVDGSVNVSAAGLDGPGSGIRVCALAIPVANTGSAVVCTESPSALGPVTVQNVAPTITTPVLPGGTVGTAYVAQMLASDPANPPTASGILDAFVWSATGLPPGLAIDPVTGVVSGTPTMAGSFMVSITVGDGDGGTATANMIIVIGSVASLTCPTPTLITAGGAEPSVDEGSSVILNATLGIAPCGCTVQWDVGCDGTRDGSGSSFTFSSVDRDGPSTTRLCLRSVPGALAVCNAPSTDLSTGVAIRNVAPTITTGSLPSGMLGSAYSATVSASDPANPPVASMTRDPIAWSATGLPPGITIDAMTGVISGTPTMAGGATARCYDVTVSANDGDSGLTRRDLQLCLTAVAMMNCPVARPNADGPYSVNEGSTASIAVAFAGSTACGCTIEWDFDCNGTADGTGLSITYDARGLDGPSTRSVCWISRPSAMGPCNSASASSNNNVRVLNVAPTITTASVPDAMVGVRYTTTIAATDPANPPVAMTTQDPLAWSIMGNPAWISIDPSTGVITASPPAGTEGMSFTFTVIVEDGDGGRTTRMFTLRVLPTATMDAGVDGGTTVDAGSDAAVVSDATVTPDAAMDASVTADGATVDGSTADVAVTVDGSAADGASASDAIVTADTSVTSDASLNGDSAARPDASRTDSGQPPFGLSGDGACSCRAAGHGGSSSSGQLAMVIAGVAMVLAARRKRQR